MRILRLLPILLLLALTGCTSNPAPETGGTSPRLYNGTASVGDFLTITLDPVAHTLSYTNISNGDTGTIPYTVNADGTYSLSDPAGNLVAAYEVPNYALLVQAEKTGANHDQPSLVTAVQQGNISFATWENSNYNYMQFRTAAGGLEVGSISVDASGNVSLTSYWPFGAVNQSGGGQFHQGIFPASQFQTDVSGSFMRKSDRTGSFDYIFGTANGVFAVDTPNGAILGFKKSTAKNFDPSFAGTYKAIYYEKDNATTGMGNLETGAPSLGNATLTISGAGDVIVADDQGAVLIQATLTPVADASYLVGAGELQDPCNGLFTFRLTTANSQQDVFVTFMDRALLFSSFTAHLPWGSGNTYDYLYGVGLK